MSEFRRRLMMAQGAEKDIPNYLCFEALEGGEFTFVIPAGLTTTDLTHFDYSKDGRNFTTIANNDTEDINFSITVNAGDKIYFKGSANRYNNGGDDPSNYLNITSDCSFNLSGNILSILYDDTFVNYDVVEISDNARNNLFRRLFVGCLVIDASDLLLPIRKIPANAYYSMFAGSTLVLPPKVIPIIDGASDGLYGMFSTCVSLTTMPDISSVSNASFRPFAMCFAYMFYNCSSLKYYTPIPYINGGRGGENSVFSNMFRGCTSLESSPIQEIRGADNNVNTFGGTGQLDKCFYNCINLETAPSLPVLTIKNNSYRNAFYGCAKLNYIKMLAVSKTSSSLQSWVSDVASTGIFVKNINATWADSGNSGVPTNWTVIYYDPSEDKYYTSQDKSQECDDHGNPI